MGQRSARATRVCTRHCRGVVRALFEGAWCSLPKEPDTRTCAPRGHEGLRPNPTCREVMNAWCTPLRDWREHPSSRQHVGFESAVALSSRATDWRASAIEKPRPLHPIPQKIGYNSLYPIFIPNGKNQVRSAGSVRPCTPLSRKPARSTEFPIAAFPMKGGDAS